MLNFKLEEMKEAIGEYLLLFLVELGAEKRLYIFFLFLHVFLIFFFSHDKGQDFFVMPFVSISSGEH